MREFKKILIKDLIEFKKIVSEKIETQQFLANALQINYDYFALESKKHLTYDIFFGLLQSASYFPQKSHPIYPQIESKLKTFFNKFQTNSEIELSHETRLYAVSNIPLNKN